ncbi:hypothetical protein H2201_008902 [Coniosporium apollinis]|uniref:Mitochondrial import inner membrane translocase subunit TIM54 n=1 Tax=Coniosporium apollinis TaxID=61459 RepID=A0ABQ9NF47_9PEZI|nr:hypothetical protein H2201_008902 [Coniosporium apollinis]
MSGSSLHVSWPDWSLFKFPPASYPSALPPPSDEATWRSPFPINEKLYNDALSPVIACTIATVYATTVTILNAYNRSRGNKPGGQPKALAAAPPRWKNVACQRFFVSGPGSGFFAVVSPAQLQEEEDARRRREMAQALPEADFVTAQVDGMLEEGLQEVDASENLILDNAAQTEVSPWLEMTRWPRYLRGYSFDEVAPLGSPADPATEPLLAEFAQSFDRIVEESHKSVCDDKVNVFDQARINSFIQRRRAWDRPLMIKLKKSTYQ